MEENNGEPRNIRNTETARAVDGGRVKAKGCSDDAGGERGWRGACAVAERAPSGVGDSTASCAASLFSLRSVLSLSFRCFGVSEGWKVPPTKRESGGNKGGPRNIQNRNGQASASREETRGRSEWRRGRRGHGALQLAGHTPTGRTPLSLSPLSSCFGAGVSDSWKVPQQKRESGGKQWRNPKHPKHRNGQASVLRRRGGERRAGLICGRREAERGVVWAAGRPDDAPSLFLPLVSVFRTVGKSPSKRERVEQNNGGTRNIRNTETARPRAPSRRRTEGRSDLGEARGGGAGGRLVGRPRRPSLFLPLVSVFRTVGKSPSKRERVEQKQWRNPKHPKH